MGRARLTKKRKAYHWGVIAEYMSIIHLVLKGYRILARRFKCKSGEIDLIAQKGNMTCFIEVKARQTKEGALYALSHAQTRRIERAAEWYMAKNHNGQKSGLSEVFYRFDIMAVEPWHFPTHVKDAWQSEAMK